MILIVSTDRGHLFTLHQRRNETIIVSLSKESLRPACLRWIEKGLHEWVGKGDEAHPRHTLSSSPDFLPRLKDYLFFQFSSFHYELSYAELSNAD